MPAPPRTAEDAGAYCHVEQPVEDRPDRHDRAKPLPGPSGGNRPRERHERDAERHHGTRRNAEPLVGRQPGEDQSSNGEAGVDEHEAAEQDQQHRRHDAGHENGEHDQQRRGQPEDEAEAAARKQRPPGGRGR